MTAAYVESIPEGLDSYPDAQIKGSLARAMVELQPANFDASRLPPPIRALFDSPPLVSDWYPECRVVAMNMAMREAFFDTDEAYLAWVRDGLDEMMSGPLYRVVFKLVSPTRLARGAARRWGAFRRGTQREVMELNENGNLGRAMYPEGLYTQLYGECLLAGLLAAYALSRAKNPTGKVTQISNTCTEIEIIYDRDKARGPALK